MKSSSISRRDFVRSTSILGASAIASFSSLSKVSGQISGIGNKPASIHASVLEMSKKTMIGLQTGVGSVAGTKMVPFFDDLQSRAHVNTLFLFSFTYIAGRVSDDISKFHGGNFANVHPEYYKDIYMDPKSLRAPDFGDVDFLAKVIPEVRKRGMKIFPWVIEDNRRPTYINGMDELYEIDLHGRRAALHPVGPCYNNPYYRNLMLGLLEDYSRSYDIDGIMWGTERQGPLGNALGAYHNGKNKPPVVTCFCKYCTEKGKKQGIDIDRVKKGFLLLEQFVSDGRKEIRLRDGYYVNFWRIILRYPEILVWEKFWTDSLMEFQQDLYTKVKSINSGLQMGFHIWHNNSFNPMYRAEQDYQLYTGYSDFIKPVLYDNCAGGRMASYVDSVGQNVYGDLSKQELLDFHYKVMNYEEKSYDQLSASGFSSDYVLRETKRAKEGVSGSKTLVWPGIGIDIPAAHLSTTESTKKAVIAAFQGGADGILLSRRHWEMKPESLSGVGAAIRELGLS